MHSPSAPHHYVNSPVHCAVCGVYSHMGVAGTPWVTLNAARALWTPTNTILQQVLTAPPCFNESVCVKGRLYVSVLVINVNSSLSNSNNCCDIIPFSVVAIKIKTI